MALPSTGITMIQVAQTLGYYAYPLYLSLLCKHQNINKWSKWKPISSTASTLTNDVIKANNYGFSNFISTGTNSPSTIYGWCTGGTLYHYDKPTGTSASPYRLGDFRNYNSGANPPYTYVCEKVIRTLGDRSEFKFSANLNTADFNMDDIFPASQHTNASLVLIDKSRMQGGQLNMYTLDSNIVSNGSYKSFSGTCTIDNSQIDSSNYYHDAVMAIKDGSIYCVVPAEPLVWFEPKKNPEISFNSGSTWIELDGTFTPEITIYQGNGNNATMLVRTGYDLQVIGGSWIHTSPAVVPGSRTNPLQIYAVEIILDSSTTNRQATFGLVNSDYGVYQEILVKQETAVPNISISCVNTTITTNNSRLFVFSVYNLSGVIGTIGRINVAYRLQSGIENVATGLVYVEPDMHTDYPCYLTVTSDDGTPIVAGQVTVDNVRQVTYVATNYMDAYGSLIL